LRREEVEEGMESKQMESNKRQIVLR